MSTCVSVSHVFVFSFLCLFYSGLFVILLTCLISKEREKEGVGLEGKKEKPRSEYTV